MEFAVCPSCEETNPGAAERCAKCGADLTQPMPVVVRHAAASAEIPAQPAPAAVELSPEVAGKAAELEAAIAKSTQARALYIKLSKLYEEAGRKDLAVAVLERCLAVDPGNTYVKHRLQILSGEAPAPIPEVFRPQAPVPAAPRPPLPRKLVIALAVAAASLALLAARWLLFPTTRLLVGDEQKASSPRFSPRGDLLAFVSGGGERQALRVLDLKKKTFRELAKVDAGYGGGFAWSPDGQRIAYVSLSQEPFGEAVYVVDVESGRTTPMAMGSEPSWGPDGSSLLMSCAGTAGEDGYAPGGLCVGNVVTGEVRRLSAPAANRAAFSPRDLTIAFEQPVDDLGAEEAAESDHAVHAPGEDLGDIAVAAQQGQKQLNMAGASSGLSRELEARQRKTPPASETGWPAGRADICTLSAIGDVLKQLTHDGHSSAPVWSADGSRILYLHSSTPSGPAEIWGMQADGSEQALAFKGPVMVWDPSQLAVSPEGRLVFPAWVKGTSVGPLSQEPPVDLFSIRPGEASARRIETRHRFKQRFALSPNGRSIVYEVHAEGKDELWMTSL